MKTAFKQPCSCGEAHITIYCKRIRPYLIPPLLELTKAGRGLSLDQIAKLSDDPLRVKRHFAELKLFRLVRKDDLNRYIPTEHGKNFLNDLSKVPEFVWTLNNSITDAPEGSEDPKYLSYSELAPQRKSDPNSTYFVLQPKLLPI